jgi:hypothetical protein
MLPLKAATVPVTSQLDVVDWHHDKMGGSWANLSIASWAQVGLVGLIRLEQSNVCRCVSDGVEVVHGHRWRRELEVGKRGANAWVRQRSYLRDDLEVDSLGKRRCGPIQDRFGECEGGWGPCRELLGPR